LGSSPHFAFVLPPLFLKVNRLVSPWDLLVRWLVGPTSQLRGTFLSGRPWDPPVRSSVRPGPRSARGTHLSGSWWGRLVSFAGPVCQVDGGTHLSYRPWAIMNYEKSKEKKNQNIALRPRPNSILRRYKNNVCRFQSYVSSSSGGWVSLFEYLHEVGGSNPPGALFVSIFLTIFSGPAWQVGGTRSSIGL
jgi:hypothetical protein